MGNRGQAAPSGRQDWTQEGLGQEALVLETLPSFLATRMY